MNCFESKQQQVIPSTLIYFQAERKTLMIEKAQWNGLGGKLELHESPLQAAQREFQEESGLLLSEQQFQALGFLQFPNFKPGKNQDWLVFVFLAHSLVPIQDLVLKSSPEGKLHWVDTESLIALPLWPGDQYFLPYVIRQQPFLGTIWYEDQEVIKHWIQPL